jgi:hypothetical protein
VVATEAPEAVEAGKGIRPNGEPIVKFASSPGRVAVELAAIDSLFDRLAPSTYPHSGPMLDKAVAKFLLDSARENRSMETLEITIGLRTAAPRPEEEAIIRSRMSSYFTNEAELAGLEQRVNRTEGWGSLRFAVPLVLFAALIAGLLSTNPSALGGSTYFTAIAYLVFITIVWVMLWGPIERLLFDSYFIRLRIHALQKLAAAKIAFRGGSVPATPTAPAMAGPGPLAPRP